MNSLNECSKKKRHSTEKPLLLMKQLCETAKTNLIVDLFIGSGSTEEAALCLDKRFIGVEMNKGYFNTARQRLENLKNAA